MDLVFDPQSQLYTSPQMPGQYFRYSFSSGGLLEPASPPPAIGSAPAPANASDGPAPTPDASTLLADYRALPVSERKRFWMLVDSAEKDFSLPQMRALVIQADAADIDFRDRAAFEAFVSKQPLPKAANGSVGGYMLGATQPANASVDYEHALLQANNGDPSVWFVQGGRRHGIPAPHVLRERFHSDFENGRWKGVLYVDPGVISAIPIGAPVPSPYEGKLLQAGRPQEGLGAALGAILGPAAGAAAALLNLEPADPNVWHIVGGKRQHIDSPELLRARYGAAWEDGIMGVGHWTKVQLVPPELLSEFVIGPEETLSQQRSASGTLPGAPPA